MAAKDEIPRTRVQLSYRTEVDGEPAKVNLPLRLLVMGDFSGGTSKDRQMDLEDRKVRNLDGKNTSEIMKDMNFSADFTVPNKINPKNSRDMKVHLKFDHINAFSPKEIAKQVPQIRGLLMLKQLLLELQANIANKKELSALLNKLYADKEAYESVKEKLKQFSAYQLPIEEESSQTIESKE